jgi:predicted nicotinamide N-methyase
MYLPLLLSAFVVCSYAFETVLLYSGSASLPPMLQRSLAAEFDNIDAAAAAGLSQGIITPGGVDELWQWYLNYGYASSDPDPSWGKVWDTAIHLARRIAADPSITSGKRVAELGCGLGLCGLAAAGAGAKTVLFLDQEPFALQMAMNSAKINGYETGTTIGDAVVAAALCGGRALPTLPTHRLADVVIASDILYDINAMPGLAKTVLQLLDAGSGRALIADPLKGRARGCRAAFKGEIEKLGGCVNEVTLLSVSNREDTVLIDIAFPSKK